MTEQRFESVVVLTGAGISAESGVPTFRGDAGLWRQYRAEDLATPQAFARNPTLVWQWYDWRRQLIAACKPNAAHRALVQMERSYDDFTLITQNVDDLHQRAGSKQPVRLHGSIWQVRCTLEGTVSDNHEVPLRQLPPRCPCGALLRPHVVWFGETLDSAALNAAYAAAERCDLMLVVGTSALVHPAASLPVVAKSKGAYLIEVNIERTLLSPYADEVVSGPATEEVPRLCARLEKPRSTA